MAQTRLDVHKRDAATMVRYNSHLVFGFFPVRVSYTYHLGGRTHEPNGIGWDGAYLWVCTDGNSGGGAAPQLIRLDPEKAPATGATIAQSIACGGLTGSADNLLDICWKGIPDGEPGAGWYGILEKTGPGARYLVDISAGGKVVRNLNTALRATARGVTYDGNLIWVSGHNFLSVFDAYDPQSGNQVVVSKFAPTINSTANDGAGIAWDGRAIHHMKKPDGVGTFFEDYGVHDNQYGPVAQLVRNENGTTPFPGADELQDSLTYDGANLWYIAHVT